MTILFVSAMIGVIIVSLWCSNERKEIQDECERQLSQLIENIDEAERENAAQKLDETPDKRMLYLIELLALMRLNIS